MKTLKKKDINKARPKFRPMVREVPALIVLISDGPLTQNDMQEGRRLAINTAWKNFKHANPRQLHKRKDNK